MSSCWASRPDTASKLPSCVQLVSALPRTVKPAWLATSLSAQPCQVALSGLPGVPPSSTMPVGVGVLSTIAFTKSVPSLQRSSAARGDEVLAGLAADIGAVVDGHEDAGLGRFLDGRQQRLAGVGEHDDDVDLLGDVGAHVGDRLGGVAAGRRVDDLLHVGIGQRLLDELHRGDAAPDVLAEAVGIGDGQRAVAGLANASPSSTSAPARAARASAGWRRARRPRPSPGRRPRSCRAPASSCPGRFPGQCCAGNRDARRQGKSRRQCLCKSQHW